MPPTRVKPVHALIGATLAIVLSIVCLASAGRAAASSGAAADVERRRAQLLAMLAAENAAQVQAQAAQGQAQAVAQQALAQQPGMPIAFAPASVVQTRNAVQTVGSLPGDALCRSRPDAAGFLQCCNAKKGAGVLDASCPLSNLTDRQIYGGNKRCSPDGKYCLY
jgi:hypothetical protein